MTEKILSGVKLMIAEDHEFTRTGLSYSLKSKTGLDIVGEAENGQDAVAHARALLPDVILMDISMPIMDGIKATQILKTEFPAVKIIILTSRQVGDEVLASLGAGADAYCMKDISTDQLVSVIEMVVQGGVWLDPAIAKYVMDLIPGRTTAKPSSEPALQKRQAYNTNLTDREYDVLLQITKGLQNKEIAQVLNISTNTVKVHVGNIIQKLAVDDRTQLAIKALQEGLLEQH